MRSAKFNAEKHKKKIIVLSVVTVICAVLVVTIPLAVLCGFFIYKENLDYRELSDAKKLYDCVTVGEIHTVKGISSELGWKIPKTRNVLDFCMKNHYLDDYVRVGEELRKNDEGQEFDISGISAKKTAKKCSHCGGVAEYYEGETAVCIYCGGIIDKD